MILKIPLFFFFLSEMIVQNMILTLDFTISHDGQIYNRKAIDKYKWGILFIHHLEGNTKLA